jgi:hypothetical protein
MSDLERKNSARGRSIVWVARYVEDFTRVKDEGRRMKDEVV